MSALIEGLSNTGINPKINNLVKGYKSTKSEYIWVLDSNIWVDCGVLRRAINIFLAQPQVGLVHHAPCGVELLSLGAYLDGIFMNCTHARVYNFINSLAIASCVIGKSNIYKKADMEAIGGLAQFGKYIAEDNMIGISIMNLGKSHQLAPDFAYQSMGEVSVSSFLQRRIRWLRVRKAAGLAVQITLVFEPFSEVLLGGYLFGLALNRLTGIDFYLYNLLHWTFWFISDMLVAKACYGTRTTRGWNDFPQFALAWFLLQLLVLPSYIWGILGNEILWRNQRYRVYANGTCESIPPYSGKKVL